MNITSRNATLVAAGAAGLSVAGIALYSLGLSSIIGLVRIPLGLFFILFLPGYGLQAAIFADNRALDSIERIGLALGLSIALIPLIAMVLDVLPWGIQLVPIIVSESLLSIAFAVIARIRSNRLPEERRVYTTFRLGVRAWWAGQNTVKRILLFCGAIALAIGLVSAGAILLVPSPGEQFTEFYIYGSNGLAEDYPRTLTLNPDAHATINIGVTNRERNASDYRLEVQENNQVIGSTEPFHLEPGENREAPLTFTPTETGDNVVIQFLLYRDEGQEAYRTLHLSMKILPAGAE